MVIWNNLIYNGKFPEYVQDYKKIESFSVSDKQVDFPRCFGIYTPLLDIIKSV